MSESKSVTPQPSTETTEPESTHTPRPLPRAGRWLRNRIGGAQNWSAQRKGAVFVPLTVLAIALLAAVTLLGIRIHSNSTINDAKASALATANENVPKLLSYKFDTVEKDLGDAPSTLTGDFKGEFVTLTQQTIIPSAKQANTVTNATVAGNSVVAASADSVTVLMFLNQSTTSKDSPDPKLDSSRVRVELRHIDDRWLIASLQPV